jgi:asparagine synthetase B (glutamine-hydrolysing)
MTMDNGTRKLVQLITHAVRASYGRDGRSVGVLVSGGIDSSTVVSFTPYISPAFTGYYQGEAYDERQWARLAVKYRDHHEIEITPQDFVEHMDACLACLEPPFEGPGTFGQYMVAKYVSQHVDVVLSGEGGDELFGGYARVMAVAGEPLPDGYEDYQLPDGYPQTLTEALAHEWEHLPALLRVDAQVTSAHGLEARAPMAEYEPLIEFVMALPPEERVGKKTLKRAMAGIVPDAILNRTDKKGFPVPYVEWAQREPVKSYLRERIGYVPDPARPWDRQWWNDLCESSRGWRERDLAADHAR